MCNKKLQNIDASLLSTISWPCFATHNDVLYTRTKSKVIRRLRGNYGFKRFLRDGYGTALEDSSRRFYKEGETRVTKFLKYFMHSICYFFLNLLRNLKTLNPSGLYSTYT